MKKPKVLVLALEYYSVQSANVFIVGRLCSHLSNYYDITIATLKIGNTPVKETNGVSQIIRTPFHSLNKLANSANNNCFDLLTMFFFKINNIITKEVYKKDVYYFVKELTEMINIKDFDMILSISHPFSSHWCASILSERFDVPWLAYSLDPFFSMATLPKNKWTKRKKLEERVMSVASKVLMIYPTSENYLHLSVEFNEKIIATELPGIVYDKYIDENDRSNHEDCRCYFIGGLYKDIRNPKAIMQAFSLMEDGISLSFIGKWPGNDFSLSDFCLPHIQYLGSKKEEEIPDIYHDADILVNIGNLVDNQMPSKIFEYISTGKPILNIYKIPNCPTLKYLSRYPLAFNIFEDDLVKDMDFYASKIQDFCLENKSKRVPLEFIMENYEANTDEKVAEFLREQIDEILNN